MKWLAAILLCGMAGIAEAQEVRGAPLGAAPSTEAPAPGSADGTDTPAPLRVIPEASWELLLKAETESKEPITTRKGTFERVPFSRLSGFAYTLPAAPLARTWQAQGGAPPERIPEPIRALDGKQVMVAGFMVPLNFDQRGHVRAFALSQNRAFCCFGIPPAMHEWIMVEVAEGVDVPYLNDIPIAVFGKLSVGEELDDGFVLSIYRMAAVDAGDLREAVRVEGR